MMKLKQKLKKIVKDDNSLGLKLEAIRALKESGAEQADVISCLEVLRQEFPDKDDHILELLDFVSGFCSNHMRIW